ncbi:uncharacterized protein LOC34621070 [Cyclospora cayetanensis]|uniref:Uncharacterized protein LOC34621070 n=1 Tax=Cyclospora cayetanensis TaxID=88456 RepID=A0A6P6RZ87_9EIME|nr:uncharacterized protein LOC34621070 [Cyclospora cayetanensis]
MEEWRGYTAEDRSDSSPSSSIDGSSDVMSYTQKANAADYLFFSQPQQQQAQQQQVLVQQYAQQQTHNPQQQPAEQPHPEQGLAEQQQALQMADYVEREQQREREVARKQQTALRRGLFSVTELEDWMGEDCPQLDRQCLIRFPLEVAETLRQRLHNAAAAAAAAAAEGAELPEPGAAALGLTIVPRPDYNYRAFDVKVSGYRGRLRGILVELPTLIETYKSVDSDILFKSGDVCQMLYVFDPQVSNMDLSSLCDKQQWEWRAGLTPPTHRIRSRKFKNIDLFDREEIRDAELELLHGLRRDTYEIEVHTELDMLEARNKEQEQPSQPQSQGKGSSSEAPKVERVVLMTEDVTALLQLVDQDDEYLSDASDILFSIQAEGASLSGADAIARPRRGRGAATGAPGGLSRNASSGGLDRQDVEASQVGLMASRAQLQLQMGQQQQQLLVQQQLGQQPLLLPQGMPDVVHPVGGMNEAEERERLRLRKEKRRQKKDRKRARREHRLQQQLMQQTGIAPDPTSGPCDPEGTVMAPGSAELTHGGTQGSIGQGVGGLEGNEDDYDGLSSIASADGQ